MTVTIKMQLKIRTFQECDSFVHVCTIVYKAFYVDFNKYNTFIQTLYCFIFVYCNTYKFI